MFGLYLKNRNIISINHKNGKKNYEFTIKDKNEFEQNPIFQEIETIITALKQKDVRYKIKSKLYYCVYLVFIGLIIFLCISDRISNNNLLQGNLLWVWLLLIGFYSVLYSLPSFYLITLNHQLIKIFSFNGKFPIEFK